jgi:hypothetical protein
MDRNHRNFEFPRIFERFLFDDSLQRFPPGAEWQQMLDVLYMAPGLDAVVEIYALETHGHIDSGQAKYIHDLINGLVDLAKRAYDGDELANLQVIAAQKMIFPEIFNLTRTDVEEVANRDSSRGGNFAARARGYAIRGWMSRLSFVLEPKGGDKWMTPTTYVQMRPRERGGTFARQDYYEIADELCRQHKKQTLQSLAIKAFQLELEQSGAPVPDVESLKRDLKLVAELDREYSEGSKFWVKTPVFHGKPLIIRKMAAPWDEHWKKGG